MARENLLLAPESLEALLSGFGDLEAALGPAAERGPFCGGPQDTRFSGFARPEANGDLFVEGRRAWGVIWANPSTSKRILSKGDITFAHT